MNADELQTLLAVAMRLPAQARAALAGALLDTLDEGADEDAERQWSDEIVRRLEEVERETVDLLSQQDAEDLIFGTHRRGPASPWIPPGGRRRGASAAGLVRRALCFGTRRLPR
jgi:hypothetical protein